MFKVFRRLFSNSRIFRSVIEIPETVKLAENAEDSTVQDMIRLHFFRAIDIIMPKLNSIMNAEHLHLPEEWKKHTTEGILMLLSNCNFCAELTFPIRRDCGDYDLITGLRVHHCMHKQPMLGGIMFHPCVTIEDVMGHSTLNTFKNALANVPFGGSHGAVCFDPSDYSENEIQKIIRRYVIELVKKNALGPGIDCGSNDVNTRQREMSWIVDSYIKTFGETDMNAISIMLGKPYSAGGILGKMEAVGWGLYNCVDFITRDKRINDIFCIQPGWDNKKFIVEGFGNVGYNSSKYFSEAGGKLIGLIEKDVSFYNEDGLDPIDMHKYKISKGTLKGYPNGRSAEADEVQCQECDLYLICSFHKTFMKKNAQIINSKIVVEGANAPITPAAEKILCEKNILVIPDLCATGGGVISSYYEWLKNISHVSFGRLESGVLSHDIPILIETLKNKANIDVSEEFYHKIFNTSEQDIIFKNVAKNSKDSACKVLEAAEQYQVMPNLRLGAYCKAVLQVFKSYEIKGLSV